MFAGEQVLNLINMGRGKGIHAVLGTQGLADLKKVGNEFQSQLLNCVNTVICHRLNDIESAKTNAEWIGAKDCYDITAQIRLQEQSLLGSVNKNKTFIIHPEWIKQDLRVGEVFYASKINGVQVYKISIKM